MIEHEAKDAHRYLHGISSLRLFLSRLSSAVVLLGHRAPSTVQEVRKSTFSIDKRLQNIVASHEAVMKLRIDDIFKRSFLRLQGLHIESISSELENLFTQIRSSISRIDRSVADDVSETAAIIENILRDTQELIKEQAGEVIIVKAPLTKRQLWICLSTYKYAAELKTLHAFISHNVMTTPGYRGLLGSYSEGLN